MMKDAPMLVNELTIMPIWDPVACTTRPSHIQNNVALAFYAFYVKT